MSAASANDDELSLREAADVLGVHYMTAYRYVRTGRLAATQDGSHWRVRRSNLAALAAPPPAGRAKRGAKKPRRGYDRELRDRLVQGDETEAWRVTQRALASACSSEDLYLDVLGPALRRVGDDWAAGRITIADEHRASAVMNRLIGRLGPLLNRPGRTRGVVVLGAPAADHHAMPSALVADVLRGRGLSVTDLGANTPAVSFVEAVAAAGKRLVATGIVVSAPLDDAVIAATVSAVKIASAAPVLLGGLAIRDDDHALRLGADAFTSTTRAAVDWFDATARSAR